MPVKNKLTEWCWVHTSLKGKSKSKNGFRDSKKYPITKEARPNLEMTF